MHKKVLIINGHPDEKSFNQGICKAYQEGAIKSNAEVQTISIRDLDFDPNLQYGYRKKVELEPDLLDAIEKIKWSEHMVWVHPLWWYGYPALMKGFIDRVFLPGVTFAYKEGASMPEKLLKGKTARIICTADTPNWYYRYFLKSPAINQLKKGTLEFCGVGPVKTTYISPVRDSKESFRNGWLEKITRLGELVK
ncbi:NAD(P)H-dependent oxidoreductase [Rapidithrix thailandica]|uniref:NAD(P)H-dependent oxidoreductase n=1 Tax=Rapidithrix thailandica TaxID=413964 RepID=A0AAW9SEI4_9BACT